MADVISVIVPIYNVELYLDRCVDSIVNQTYKELEIILVDDGSPDNCPTMCDEWARKDCRIKVIHKKNGGLSDARNCGIRAASGEYILFVDSDDRIVQDACERLINYAADVDIVVGESTIYEPTGIINRVHTNLEDGKVYSGSEYSTLAIRVGEWFAAACYNMYRREFLIKNNLFFAVGILHEDIEYLPRLFLAAKKIRYMNYQFYAYIIRENSICGIKSQKHLHDLLETYSSWKRLNDSIRDDRLKRMYNAALSKYFIHTCRQYHVKGNVFPEGMDRRFLLINALNIKEFVKTIAFIVFRKAYVNM